MPDTEVVEKNPKLFVNFKPHKETKLPSGKPSKPLQKIEIKNGHYLRKFDAKDAPFEVENDDELQMLVGTRHFVEHKPEPESDEGESGSENPSADKAAAKPAPAKPAATAPKRNGGSKQTKDSDQEV